MEDILLHEEYENLDEYLTKMMERMTLKTEKTIKLKKIDSY